MWRYYITRPHPNTALMSETSRTNWNACDAVYKTLSDPDRKLISEYAVQIAHDFTFAGMYADKNKMTSYNVLNRIKYIFRQTAIKRGLWEYWDHDRIERTEQDTTDQVGKAEGNRDERTNANGKAERINKPFNALYPHEPEVVIDNDVYTIRDDARPYLKAKR